MFYVICIQRDSSLYFENGFSVPLCLCGLYVMGVR
jgi:hypothetical protein